MNNEKEIGKPSKNESDFDRNMDSKTGFMCGGCELLFEDISSVHNHMRDHVGGGSYNYNHVSRIAFPVSVCKDASTQTFDLDVSETNNQVARKTKHTKIDLPLDSFDIESSIQNKGTGGLINHGFREVKTEVSDDDTDDYDSFDHIGTQFAGTTKPLDIDGEHDSFRINNSTKVVHQQDDETANSFSVNDVIVSTEENPTESNKEKGRFPHSDKNLVRFKKYETFTKKIHLKGHRKRSRIELNKPGDSIKDPHAKVECEICGKQVKKMNLRTHRRRIHERIKVKEEGPVNCEQCGRSFPKLRNLALHRKIHRGKHLTCCHCNHLFSSHEELIAHINEHNTCKTFNSQESTESDDNDAPISDSNVDFDLEKASVLDNKEPEEPSRCLSPEQSVAFSVITKDKSQSSQKTASELNTGDARVNCEKCGAVTKKKYLRIHLIRYHNEPKRPVGRHKKIKLDTNQRKVECELCGKQVKKMNLRTHHRRVHEKVKYEGPVICETCGKVFPNPRNLAMHRKIHTDKYLTCRHCNYLSSTHEEFLAHLNEHNKARSFACHVCSAVFSQSGRLSKHVRSVHMGEKRYFCDICSKGFYGKGNLDDHRVIHFEATLPCSYCDRKFKDPSSKKRHEKIHLGHHTYTCYICSHGFIQSGCYKSHMEKMHSVANKEAMAVHHELNSATKLLKGEREREVTDHKQTPISDS